MPDASTRSPKCYPPAVRCGRPSCVWCTLRPHINADGLFQSDKYPATPAGKVPLSTKDPTAQDLLWTYAQRRRAVDADFAQDLETCLRAEGYDPTARPPERDRLDEAAARFNARFGRLPGVPPAGGGVPLPRITKPPTQLDQAKLRASYARVFDDPKVQEAWSDLFEFMRSCLSRDRQASQARRFLFPHPETRDGWIKALEDYTRGIQIVYRTAMLAYFGFGADYPAVPLPTAFNAAVVAFFAEPVWEWMPVAGDGADTRYARRPDAVTPPGEPNE